MKVKLLIHIILIVLGTNLLAQTYPFDLPANLNASINIKSQSQEKYNNLLLGTNIHHFTKTEEKEFVNKFDPITIRFPHGLWSNWYDWRRDVTRLYGDEKFNYKQGTNNTLKEQTVGMLANIYVFDTNNIKVGIDGATELNTNKKNSSGKGFDMMWTFNMSADGTDFSNGSPETMLRYNDLIQRGFEVKDIELGNECFYPNQRSSIIPNAEDYIARAKSMSAALKAEDPSIRVSIPLLRRDSWANPNWNTDLTSDQSYFDAISIHTYVGSDPDNAENSDEAFGTALTARKHLLASITEYPHKVAPSKPIWLTEWGVKSGGPNAVSALGAVDCFLMMSENQDIFNRANWFSTNGKLNSMLVWEKYIDHNDKEKERIKYPLEKTLFGSAYEITRSVLEYSTLIEGYVDVPNIVEGVKAVNARVVLKRGKTTVFVVNLTDQEVPFEINIDDLNYMGDFVHKALSFSSMDEEMALAFDDDPLSIVQEGSGSVSLPKFSINTIELSDLVIENELGVKDLPEIANLKVSPNPSDGVLNVQLGESSTANYKLISLSGTKVVSGTFYSEVKLQLDDYHTGMYLLEITTSKARSVQKVIFK